MVNSSRRPSSSTATRVSSDSALMITSLWTSLIGLISRFTFVMTFWAAILMASTMPLGCSRTSTGLNSSFTSAGVSRFGSRKFLLLCPAGASGRGVPSAGSPAATFSARSISDWRELSKTRWLPPIVSAVASGLGSTNFFCAWGLGRKRIPPRRRREKFLPSLIILIAPAIQVHVLQNANRDHRTEHRGTAITEERQRNTCHRHQANIHADIDEYVAEEHRNDAHRQQFSQAIACLAGNSYAGKQHHGVQPDHAQAPHECLLLGNDGEDEIVMRHRAWQKSQGVLRPALPPLPKDSAAAHRDERLLHVIGVVLLLDAGRLAFRFADFSRRVIAPKVNEQSAFLVVLQFDLPLRR